MVFTEPPAAVTAPTATNAIKRYEQRVLEQILRLLTMRKRADELKKTSHRILLEVEM